MAVGAPFAILRPAMGRARPIVWRALGLSAPRGPFGWALRASLRLSLLLWGVELLWPLLSAQAPATLGVLGVGASLGLSLLAALVAGSVLGLWAWALLGSTPEGNPLSGLFGEDPQRPVVSLVAALLLLPFFALGAFVLSEAVIAAMAQPHFAATTVVGVHLGLVLVAAVLWLPVRALAARLVAGLSRVPPLGWVLARLPRTLSVLAGIALLLTALVLIRFWAIFQFLPWAVILPLGAAAVLTLALTWLARRARPLVVVEGGVFMLALVAGVLALSLLDGRSADGRRATRRTLGAQAGHKLALAVLDFDRDGHMHVLGGRDCAPFDAAISPVAVDIPDNGVDEDCDGADLDPSRLAASVRRDWPLPGGYPKNLPVVLITVDAFAANRMAVLGGQRDNTPQIDALARQGTLFTACFSQGPSTRLSFPSIMTSRWDTQIGRRLEGRHPFPIEAREQMLAEILAQAGYQTAAIVSDRYFTRKRWSSITDGFQRVVESPAKVGKKGHNSKQVTDTALAALARHSADEPLFLWAHYYDAHSPHRQPEQGPRYGTSREDIYDAELGLVDAEVGRLVRGIRKRFGTQVLIALTADHGIAFDAPRHRKFNYGYDLYSVVLHVPLIFVGPEIARGTQDAAVSTMDVAPTITNLLGIRRKLPFEGASLVPELLEGRASRPQRLVHQFYITERLRKQEDPLEIMSLRTERYHLIHDRRVDAYELYDWREDYLEREDLSGSAGAARTFDALRQQLALYTYRLHGRSQGHGQGPGEVPAKK